MQYALSSVAIPTFPIRQLYSGFIAVIPIPEPMTYVLVGMGLIGLGMAWRHIKK
jgi:hypothetical protein